MDVLNIDKLDDISSAIDTQDMDVLFDLIFEQRKKINEIIDILRGEQWKY